MLTLGRRQVVSEMCSVFAGCVTKTPLRTGMRQAKARRTVQEQTVFLQSRRRRRAGETRDASVADDEKPEARGQRWRRRSLRANQNEARFAPNLVARQRTLANR